MGFLKESDEILSVGEFSRRFKNLVKSGIPELWIRGEISNLKTYSSGHTYFTLKDGEASLSAVLFKGYSRAVPFRLEEGMGILAYGEIGVYEARGSYQLTIKAALRDGVGELGKKFEQLKKKLSDEGLFDKSRKRPIPPLPRNIGVITSPSGAAIADFCRILRRRGWCGNVWIFPARVQGAEAAGEIVSQINFAREFKAGGESLELLILMRGGGSLEDLWPFNEELVARAVAGSPIPTISAVGHEIDFTLSDFAADLRAETPSAAAEYISSSRIEAESKLGELSSSLTREFGHRLNFLFEKLNSLSGILRTSSAVSKILNLNMALDEAESRLGTLFARRINSFKEKVYAAQSGVSRINPGAKIELFARRTEWLSKQLWLLGAESALRRGYALLSDSRGNMLSSTSKINPGEKFFARLLDGEILARAERIKAADSEKNSGSSQP